MRYGMSQERARDPPPSVPATRQDDGRAPRPAVARSATFRRAQRGPRSHTRCMMCSGPSAEGPTALTNLQTGSSEPDGIPPPGTALYGVDVATRRRDPEVEASDE